MGLSHTAILALAACDGLVAAAVTEKRQAATTKYCPGATSLCFSEFTTPTSNIVYRIAIPDVSSAPFDVLLQIVAPISTTGWAGLAWGGSMTKNPLTVGWSSGSSAIASSRWATGHSLPQAYTGATYTVLPTSTTNATHWQLDVLCSGCSQWGSVSLNPNGANTLAWAKGSRAVTTPSSNASSFAYHDDKGVYSHDLSLGKIPMGVFDAIAYDAGSGGDGTVKPSSSSSSALGSSTSPTRSSTSSASSASSSTSTPPAVTTVTSTSRPTVITSVTTLPARPSTTTIVTKPSTTTSSSSTPVWTPDQPLTTPPVTTRTTVVVPPKSSTSTTATWAPTYRPPVGGRPPWRGPPWRRPPGVVEGEDGQLAGEE